jgi:hypothetical protein
MRDRNPPLGSTLYPPRTPSPLRSDSNPLEPHRRRINNPPRTLDKWIGHGSTGRVRFHRYAASPGLDDFHTVTCEQCGHRLRSSGSPGAMVPPDVLRLPEGNTWPTQQVLRGAVCVVGEGWRHHTLCAGGATA